MPEVRRIARRVSKLFTHQIDLEELVQAGYVGLVSASNTYDPKAGSFPAYSYFRVRGAMIDSQKRKPFREQQNRSLSEMADAHDGWLPPSVDTDSGPLPSEIFERKQIEQLLRDAIAALPDLERQVLRANLEGQSLAATAAELGRSLTWTRAKLAEARELVRAAMRGI
jgi:RNA polymerase sigma factor (sigma-70 family)